MCSLISSFLSIIHRTAVLVASFQFFKLAKHFPTPVPLHKLKRPSAPITRHYSCFFSSQSKCQPLRTFSTLILFMQRYLHSSIIIVHPWAILIPFITTHVPISFLVYYQSPTSSQKLHERRAEPSLFHVPLSTQYPANV